MFASLYIGLRLFAVTSVVCLVHILRFSLLLSLLAVSTRCERRASLFPNKSVARPLLGDLTTSVQNMNVTDT